MYCSGCGNPLSPGLSYCNRCGVNLIQRSDAKGSPVNAFLTAITLIGVVGLGIMLGGAMALRNGAHLDEMLIAFYMLFTFSIVVITEALLVRQLSRFTRDPKQLPAPPFNTVQNGLPPAPARNLVDSGTSVTENTTRTLKYAGNEPIRR
jgi:hypothetical protein